jgi:hypothetical protein
VTQGITLLRVTSAATSVEMETTHAGNVWLVGHNKSKKLTLGFIVSLRWAKIFSSHYTYWIEISRLVFLVPPKESSWMSSPKLHYPVWVLLRMYRISKLKVV